MKFHEARQEYGGMEVGLIEDLNDFRADMSDGCVSDCAVNVRLMKRRKKKKKVDMPRSWGCVCL